MEITTDAASGVLMVPHDRLQPDPQQPRKIFGQEELQALAENIRARRARGRGLGKSGLIHPLVARWEAGAVAPDGTVKQGARLWITDGERRWRACHDEGSAAEIFLPVVIEEESHADAYDTALATSLHRTDLSREELARAFQAAMNAHGENGNQIAKRYNLSAGFVHNCLSLLEMAADVRAMVGARDDSFSSARLIDTVDDAKTRARLIDAVLHDNASHEAIKLRVDEFKGKNPFPEEKEVPGQYYGRRPSASVRATVARHDAVAALDSTLNQWRAALDSLQAAPAHDAQRRKLRRQLKEIDTLRERWRDLVE